MKKRKICVVTGTRAEYGLLYWLMKSIKDDPKLELQVIATGMHLSPEFGLTYKEIEKDGFIIDRKVEMILSADTPSALSKSTGLAIISFADALLYLKPDVMLIHGDRFEVLAAVIAAHFFLIPVGHVGGGEVTGGVIDDAIRHSITKLSWWHFVATNDYKKRVIQLGETPQRVFNVGDMGVENIKKTQLLTKHTLEIEIGFKFGEKNLSVTFHPITLEHNSSKIIFDALLACLKDLKDTCIIFTKSNSDTYGRIINSMIDDFVSQNNGRAIAFTSMGRLKYLSTLQFVDGVVGNSSSGITEAPTFKIGTINIGDRQRGRLIADSVINCEPNENSIKKALDKLYSCEFQDELKKVKNPYADGNTTEKVLSVLRNEPLPKELKKEFYDL